MIKDITDITHPYACYGLAVTLFLSKISPGDLSELSEDELREAFIRAIESGLSNFRMMTKDDPKFSSLLRYEAIRLHELEKEPFLVASKGLAEKGKYLYPSIVTTEEYAKNTYNTAIEVKKLLEEKTSLNKRDELKRSFAPTTAKINSGKISQSAPKTTLLEVACCLVTALTPLKPAAFIQEDKSWLNTTLIPDLPLNEMFDFVELFHEMLISGLDGNLMEVTLLNTNKEKTGKYKRPRLFDGNYPFATKEHRLGAVKLLGAIGKWAERAGKIEWAKKVLNMIAGKEDKLGKPILIINYNNVSQEQFTHHIVTLSLDNKLCEIIQALTRYTKLFSELDTDIDWKSQKRQTFYLLTNRFLQAFDLSAWKDFLSIRAEYSEEVQPLFKEYFMNTRKIDEDIVKSARVLGQWLNYAAYSVAESEVKPEIADRDKKVKQAKAKILVELESAAMSAKTPVDMLQRISTRTGRLLQKDLPVGATRYMDATASGEILPEDALHLLLAYLRLRSEKKTQ